MSRTIQTTGADEVIGLTKSQLTELVARLKADANYNKKSIGLPGAFYANMEDYEQKQQYARDVLGYVKSIRNKDHMAIEKFYQQPGFVTKANFNETTDAQGGYLVPTIWDTDIAVVADQYGFARRMFRNYPMRTKTHNLHRGTTVIGSFTAEGTPPTPSDSANFFTRTALTAKRCSIAYIVTEEELEDAIPEFVAYMTRELGRGLAKIEDQVFWKGQVANGDAFDGLLYASGTNTVYMGDAIGSGKTAFSNISWTDLVNLQNSVKTGALDNAVFVTNRTIFSYLRKEKDTTNRPIWSQEMPMTLTGQQGLQALGASVRWTPLGIPMVVVPDDIWPTTAVSTPAVAFGDFSEYAYFGVRKGMTTKTFDQYYNSVALSGANFALEISERIGVAFPAPAAFGILKTAAS